MLGQVSIYLEGLKSQNMFSFCKENTKYLELNSTLLKPVGQIRYQKGNWEICLNLMITKIQHTQHIKGVKLKQKS